MIIDGLRLIDKVSGDDYGSDNDHGSKCAGIIAATGDNGSCIAGINWYATLYSEPKKNANGYDRLLQALPAIATSNVHCLNMSYGTYEFCNPGLFDWECDVVLSGVLLADIYNMNILPIAAIGNNGLDDTFYPAAFEHVMAVGATDIEGARFTESSYDPNSSLPWASNYGSYLDIMAPGVLIPTITSDPQGHTLGHNGTSAAAPHVAGVASLLFSVDPNLYNDDVKNILTITAKDIDPAGWDEYTGYGLMDAYEAIKLLYPPYSYDHLSTNGGTDSDLGNYPDVFTYQIGDDERWGRYIANIHKITKSVSFNSEYVCTPYVWGRGVPTKGYYFSSRLWGTGHCDVSNITKYGCDITTYVYHLRTVNGGDYGWYPCEPSQVEMHYTVLGIEDLTAPSVTVIDPNGGEYYHTYEVMHIEWDVEDEWFEGVRCSVSKNITSGDGSWTVLASNVLVDSNGHGEFNYRIPTGQENIEPHWRIRVIANDSNQNQGLDMSDADLTVEYYSKPDDEPIPPPIPKFSKFGWQLTNCFLSEPRPNPFNPSTTFWYGSANECNAQLAIYDARGRLVKTFLKNTPLSPDFYSKTWDGRNNSGVRVSSGVYFLKFIAGDYSKTQKLILLQ